MITKADADKMVKAALEKVKEEEKSFTKEETEARIKAAVEEAVTRTREDMEKERLITSITDLQTKTGVLTEEEKEAYITKLEAMDIQTLTAFYENAMKYAEKINVKAAELKDIQFPVIDVKGDIESSIPYEEEEK
jgi:NADH:ubiquinone oxidoreductase subunit E